MPRRGSEIVPVKTRAVAVDVLLGINDVVGCAPPFGCGGTAEYLEYCTQSLLHEYSSTVFPEPDVPARRLMCTLRRMSPAADSAPYSRLRVVHVNGLSCDEVESLHHHLVVVCGVRALLCAAPGSGRWSLCVAGSPDFVGLQDKPFTVRVDVYVYVGSFVRDLTGLESLRRGEARSERVLCALADPQNRAFAGFSAGAMCPRVPYCSQQRAIVAGLAHCVEAVQGPPGTGKSTLIYHIVSSLLPPCEVALLVAVQNRAIDALVERFTRVHGGPEILVFGEPERLGETAARYTLQSQVMRRIVKLEAGLRVLQTVSRDGTPLCDWHRVAGLLVAKQDLQAAAEDQVLRLLDCCRVVVCTIDRIAVLARDAVFAKLFDRVTLCCVDEAGTVPEYKIAQLALTPARGVVMVGDQSQLPPFSAPRAVSSESVLARMQRVGCEIPMLRTQFRMHPRIAACVSKQSYGGLLETDARIAALREKVVGADAMYWVGSAALNTPRATHECVGGDGSSFYNKWECDAIVGACADAARRGMRRGVLVVCFYAAQVDEIVRSMGGCEACSRELGRLLRVCTVDAAQGSEADVVVLSCVRSNVAGQVGFLADKARLNVAISRANLRLIVVGDPRTVLRAGRAWCALYAACRRVDDIDARMLLCE